MPSLPEVKAVVAIMDGVEDTLPGWACGEYEALSASACPAYPFQDFDENAVATTFYTTGTTGNLKGVCFTHRQIVLHSLAANGQCMPADQGMMATGSGTNWRRRLSNPYLATQTPRHGHQKPDKRRYHRRNRIDILIRHFKH